MIMILTPASATGVMVSTLSVCLSLCVYSGYIMHHYNGIWGTCAPGRRNIRGPIDSRFYGLKNVVTRVLLEKRTLHNMYLIFI